MKRCFKCGIEKPLTEFYRHSRMADGHLNKCKTCAKDDVSRHRAKNIRSIIIYDRVRNKTHARKKQRQAHQRIHGYPGFKVMRALRIGKLKRLPCTVCSTTVDVQAHHEDYSKPLDVVWLCIKHHNELHQKKRAHSKKEL